MAALAEILRTQAAERANSNALVEISEEVLTFHGLWQQVERTARSLAAEGVARGDRVAIVLPNGPQMAVAFLSVASFATAAPLNPRYRKEEFAFYLKDLDAKAVLVEEGEESACVAAARERGVQVLPLRTQPGVAGAFSLGGAESKSAAVPQFNAEEEDALVLHTSGTTSRPKIVPLTQRNICASALNIAATLRLGPEDVCLNVMPLFHIHGLMAAILASLTAGAAVVCTPGFDAMKFFGWLREFEPTWYTAVPTMHQAILARAARNQDAVRESKLRLIRSSSASLPPQVLAELEKTFGAPVIESYGMTEAAHQMTSNPLPPGIRKPGSVGPAAGPQIAVMGEDGQLLPAGRRGEVVIRGENVTAGYENRPEANAAAFVNGWFRTGDQGYLDAYGYLFLTGRLKEIINRGGEKISPREVDEVLLDHPAVAQAVTFGMPHQKLGEEVAAAVVLSAGAQFSERELKDFLNGRLADFKVPRKIVFLREIPKGPTGKVQRIGLAERLGLG